MFDFSLWELLVIGVIALVVVGPDRLPALARTIGLWVGRARATVSSLRTEFEREVNAEGLRDTERAIRRQASETEESVRSAVDIGSPRQFEGAGDDAQGSAKGADAGDTAAREATDDDGEAAADDAASQRDRAAGTDRS